MYIAVQKLFHYITSGKLEYFCYHYNALRVGFYFFQSCHYTISCCLVINYAKWKSKEEEIQIKLLIHIQVYAETDASQLVHEENLKTIKKTVIITVTEN